MPGAELPLRVAVIKPSDDTELTLVPGLARFARSVMLKTSTRNCVGSVR
jgi:hypothetical protein